MSKKLQPEELPPVPRIRTEREQKAAELPRFNSVPITTSPEQMDGICNLFKTSHEEIALRTMLEGTKGTLTENSPAPKKGEYINKVLQQFSELKPESYLESMLLAQMIQVSDAAGNCMHRAFLEGQGFKVKELYANLAIKFHRTFVAQIEALQKLRGKGGQKVTVEHVHVHEGGQAIVGNVNQAPGGGGKNEN